MTGDQPRSEGTPDWVGYLVIVVVSLLGSLVNGCLNRQDARHNREQLMGEMDKIRNEVRAKNSHP